MWHACVSCRPRQEVATAADTVERMESKFDGQPNKSLHCCSRCAGSRPQKFAPTIALTSGLCKAGLCKVVRYMKGIAIVGSDYPDIGLLTTTSRGARHTCRDTRHVVPATVVRWVPYNNGHACC